MTKHKNQGFTLAEVLITLGIIGVVAALIIPMFIQNYKNQATASKLKQTYAILKQAEQRAVPEFGDIANWTIESGDAYGNDFIKKYYAPYLKTVPCGKYTTDLYTYKYTVDKRTIYKGLIQAT